MEIFVGFARGFYLLERSPSESEIVLKLKTAGRHWPEMLHFVATWLHFISELIINVFSGAWSLLLGSERVRNDPRNENRSPPLGENAAFCGYMATWLRFGSIKNRVRSDFQMFSGHWSPAWYFPSESEIVLKLETAGRPWEEMLRFVAT